jgi:hypothetical protein
VGCVMHRALGTPCLLPVGLETSSPWLPLHWGVTRPNHPSPDGGQPLLGSNVVSSPNPPLGPLLDSFLSRIISTQPQRLGELTLAELDTLALSLFTLQILDPCQLYILLPYMFSTFEVWLLGFNLDQHLTFYILLFIGIVFVLPLLATPLHKSCHPKTHSRQWAPTPYPPLLSLWQPTDLSTL